MIYVAEARFLRQKLSLAIDGFILPANMQEHPGRSLRAELHKLLLMPIQFILLTYSLIKAAFVIEITVYF